MKTPQLNTRPVWHKLLRKDWTPAALDELTRLVTGPFFTGFRKIDYFAPE